MEKESGDSTLTIVSPASSTTCTQLSCIFSFFNKELGDQGPNPGSASYMSNLADLICPSVSLGFPIFKMKELE